MEEGNKILTFILFSILLLSCSKGKYYQYHCSENGKTKKVTCNADSFLKIKHHYFSLSNSIEKYHTFKYQYVVNPTEKDYSKICFDTIDEDVGQYFKYEIHSDSLFISGYNKAERKKNKRIPLFSLKGNREDSLWHSTVSFFASPFNYNYIWQARYIGEESLLIDNEARECFIIEEKNQRKRIVRIFIDKKELIPIKLIFDNGVEQVLSFKKVK